MLIIESVSTLLLGENIDEFYSSLRRLADEEKCHIILTNNMVHSSSNSKNPLLNFNKIKPALGSKFSFVSDLTLFLCNFGDVKMSLLFKSSRMSADRYQIYTLEKNKFVKKC